VLDESGRPQRSKIGADGPGTPLCYCQVIPTQPGEVFNLHV
jgi:hypothetical protein